jgi:iron complex outermembrane receptor protein
MPEFFYIRRNPWLTSFAALCMAIAAHTHAGEQPLLAAGADPDTLDEVVVTAQKRAQPIEEVPISMVALDRKLLEDSRAASLTEMQHLAPNFSYSLSGYCNTITIRGVGGGGRNIGFDTRAGIYVDGVYMGQSQALNLPLYDIEQVEVLRGPQGHLYGRNTVSGAINITTRAPKAKTESSFRAVAGNHNTREGFAYVSGPLSEKLLGKFFLGYETRDGYTQNLFNNRKLDDLDRLSTRGQLAIQANDRLVIDLAADHADIKQNSVLGETTTGMFDAPLPGGPYPDYTVNTNMTPHFNNRMSGASLTANYEMEGSGILTAITGYRSTHQDIEHDEDWSPNDTFRVKFTDKIRQVSQEIRLASPAANSLRSIAGIYLTHETADSLHLALAGNDTAMLVTHPLAGIVPFGALLGLNPGDAIPVAGTVKTSSYALFGSLDYDLTDKAALNLGARYTKDRKNMLFNIDGTRSGAMAFATLSKYTGSRTDAMLTPAAGISYALDKDTRIYGKYSTGYKSGGWNLDYLTASQIASGFEFNKEKVGSYELGIKGAALDRRLSYSFAAFHSTFRDFQVFQFIDVGGGVTEMRLRNAAKAESTGAEASLRMRLAHNLEIGGNIGILKATFKSFPGGLTGGGDAAGKYLPDAPSFTSSITANYTLPAPALNGKFELHGEYSHRSNSYSSADNIESLDGIGSRNIVNARASFLSAGQGRMKLSLWARNLFNDNYTTLRSRDFFGNRFVRRGEPRMFGIEGGCSF